MALTGWDAWAGSNHLSQCAGRQRCGGLHRSAGAHSSQQSLRRQQRQSLVQPPQTQTQTPAPRQGSKSRQQRRRQQQAVQAHYGGAGALGPALNGQLLRVIAASGIGGAGREEVGEPAGPRSVGRAPVGDPLYLEFPPRAQQEPQQPEDPPLIRVRLSVHYRVHSRQMLCIGGSQIPFGWSFLSIAKVPMQWSEGDVWTTDVELPAGSRVEYKYVIMEEQDWTSQVSEDAEGIVSFSYRTQPDDPPDVQTIQKQMAIVAWQPGPNRVVQVPDLILQHRQEEVRSLKEGEVREREPARSLQQQQQQQQQRSGRQYGQQAFGQGLRAQQPAASAGSASGKDAEEKDPLAGTWETLSLADGDALVERRDVWGLPDPVPRVNPLEGLRFDS